MILRRITLRPITESIRSGSLRRASYTTTLNVLSFDCTLSSSIKGCRSSTTQPGFGRHARIAPLQSSLRKGPTSWKGGWSGSTKQYSHWTLRHLQLTHYRVNELGDIQTEEPVHGGLTEFGAAVIGRCNALGIVVDVAHGTLDLVRRAAAVTSKPLVLSHTSLTTRPRTFTRLITPEHAKLVAGTGGVIGIWPVKSIFPDMDALAAGIARMASVVGIDHVALGTDTMGLVGPATFDSHAELPGLARALLVAGLDRDDVRKVLGGNYARVFAVTMAV